MEILRATHYWNENTPGSLWNCKCDWEETDEPVTNGNPVGNVSAKGLEGNPAKTGEIFTDECPYIKRTDSKGVNDVDTFFKPILEHSELYKKLLADTQYKDIDFNWSTGGLKATHIDHHFDKKGGLYEKHVQIIGFKEGHSIILESEKGFNTKRNEGLWDDKAFEVAGRETATENNILRGLVHCAKTPDTQIAILYFPNGGFNKSVMNKAVARYIGYQKVNGFSFVRFSEIICMQNETIIYKANI